jgi:predicted transcriptional regulator
MKKNDVKYDKLIAVRMDSDIADDLEKIGLKLDRSVSWLIRKACEEFVQRNKK